MTIKLPLRELKPRGYKFQKLFARDYITYKKSFDNHDVWVWSIGKSIEIDGLHQHTDNVINFFSKNFNAEPDKDYLWIEINRTTGEVRFREHLNYFKQLSVPNNPYFKEWSEKYLHKKSFTDVVKEIEKLSGKKLLKQLA